MRTSRDVDDAFHFRFLDEYLELGIHITDISNIKISDETFDKFISYYSTFYWLSNESLFH